MVRIFYQRSMKGQLGMQGQRSVVEHIEKEFDLTGAYVLGIDFENNVVVVDSGSTGDSGTYVTISYGSIIETDTPSIYVTAENIYERGGEDAALERIEAELELRGVYVLGRDKQNNVVIVHKGRQTKDLYLKEFGYGPVPRQGVDVTGKIVTFCSPS